jgi:hypothetical protein
MMNDPASEQFSKAMERVLELSADTQIQRRETAPESPAFHNLTGAIAAYGRVLGLLSKFQQLEEERYLVIGALDVVERVDLGVRPL